MTQLLDVPSIDTRSAPSDGVANARRPAARRPGDGSAGRKFRPDIEGLRAIAVISVVLYHANLGVRGGYVGVDVFFVISGFLITRQLLGSLGRSYRNLPTFYAHRVKRLLPASVTVVIVTVIAARLWASPLQVRSIATDGIYTTFYGLNYRLAIEGTQYLNQGDAVSPLQHFWSLGVEEQFYLGWPVLIVTIGLLARRFRTPVLAAALVALVVVSYRWSILITDHSAPWAYFSLQTRAWELALGALVAVGSGLLVRLPKVVAEVGGAAGLVAVIASCFLMSDATKYPGSVAALPVGGAALIIACGVGGRRRIERLLGESAMQCVGRASYSWYLWHWPMLIMTPIILGHALGWQGRAIVVWASLVVAIMSYLLIEDPGRRLHLPNLPWLGVGALLSAGVVAASCVVILNPPSLVGHGDAVTLATGSVVGTDPTANNAFLGEVKSAVAAGMNTTKSPSNLTPNPSHAAADVPYASQQGCHLDYLVVEQGPCVFGDPNATQTAVLFGDSHMEQWEPAFAAAGAQLHWKIISWTKAACPAADITVKATTLNRTYTECDTWRTQTIARIAALKPNLVFVGESENSQGVEAITPDAWVTGTLKTLDALKSQSGAKVVFMGDNPVPRVTVSSCVASHLDDVRACQTDTAHAYTYPDRHKAVAPAVTKAGFDVVDPKDWICAPTGCPPIVGNYLVYRDATHISVEYVEYLTPLIAPLLKV